MSLTKRVYTDFDRATPVSADNLNEIQDEVIASVKFHENQQLTDTQKERARLNIGIDYTVISTYS